MATFLAHLYFFSALFSDGPNIPFYWAPSLTLIIILCVFQIHFWPYATSYFHPSQHQRALGKMYWSFLIIFTATCTFLVHLYLFSALFSDRPNIPFYWGPLLTPDPNIVCVLDPFLAICRQLFSPLTASEHSSKDVLFISYHIYGYFLGSFISVVHLVFPQA